jgi:hypothetical protein
LQLRKKKIPEAEEAERVASAAQKRQLAREAKFQKGRGESGSERAIRATEAVYSDSKNRKELIKVPDNVQAKGCCFGYIEGKKGPAPTTLCDV